MPGSPSSVNVIFEVEPLAFFYRADMESGSRFTRTAFLRCLHEAGKLHGRYETVSDEALAFASKEYRYIQYELASYVYNFPFFCPGAYDGGLREGFFRQVHTQIATDGRDDDTAVMWVAH
jgi:hypothetical protein